MATESQERVYRQIERLSDEVRRRTVIHFGNLSVFQATTYPTMPVVCKRPPAQGMQLGPIPLIMAKQRVAVEA